MLLRLILLITLAFPSFSMSKPLTGEPKVIIILDDLGYRTTDLSAFSLPTEVAFSILPETPFGQAIAQRAHQQGRTVMLHMPMQAKSDKAMGPLGLSIDMYPTTITDTLRRALKSVPYAIGVNNHMGSVFTGHANGMRTFMEEIKRQGLFFVDSRTSIYTKGFETAQALDVPSTSRQIFLDHQKKLSFLQQQFEKTKVLARKNGSVVVIAHPYPETLRFLNDSLPTLKKQGIHLTSVADFLYIPPSLSKGELSIESVTAPKE
jgi:polysaccharide deacetylase 2 family uncharacterized protein YibQ